MKNELMECKIFLKWLNASFICESRGVYISSATLSLIKVVGVVYINSYIYSKMKVVV